MQTSMSAGRMKTFRGGFDQRYIVERVRHDAICRWFQRADVVASQAQCNAGAIGCRARQPGAHGIIRVTPD